MSTEHKSRTGTTLALRDAGGAQTRAPLAKLYRGLLLRVEALLRGSEVLRTVAPEQEPVETIHHAATAVSREVEGLRLSGAIPDEPVLRSIESRLTRLEERFLALDDSIPTGALREVELEQFPESAVLAYLSFLAAHLEGRPATLARLELLVTRCCSRPGRDGRRELRPRAEILALLEDLAQRSLPGTDRRDAALEFLRAARRRIAEHQTLEELFGGTVYTELHGLKVSLGADLLDPALLHELVKLNLVLDDLVRRHLERRAKEGKTVGELGTQASVEEHFARARERARLEGAQAFARAARPALRRRWIVRGAALVILLLGLTALLLDRPHRTLERPLEPARTQGLSTLLKEARLVGPGGHQLLAGTLDAAAWTGQSRRERRASAEALAGELDAQLQIGTAVVTHQGELYLLVRGGKVAYLR
ncbi:MAG: hypothetical protein P1V51_04830 [Deltaproteobacteria bacterium]|nr:hypothetical protein [Deltaproteobacteria bacterium]